MQPSVGVKVPTPEESVHWAVLQSFAERLREILPIRDGIFMLYNKAGHCHLKVRPLKIGGDPNGDEHTNFGACLIIVSILVTGHIDLWDCVDDKKSIPLELDDPQSIPLVHAWLELALKRVHKDPTP